MVSRTFCGTTVASPLTRPRVRVWLSSLLLQDGCAMEQLVMEAQLHNHDFAFLFDLKSSEHLYYR